MARALILSTLLVVTTWPAEQLDVASVDPQGLTVGQEFVVQVRDVDQAISYKVYNECYPLLPKVPATKIVDGASNDGAAQKGRIRFTIPTDASWLTTLCPDGKGLAKAEQKYVIAVTPAPAVDLVNAQPFIQPIPIQRTVSVHSGSFLDQQAVLDADLTWLTVSAWYLRVLTDRSASPAIWVSEPWSATASTPDSFALDVPAAWVAKYYEKSDAKKFLRMNSSSDLSRTYLLHGSLYAGTKDHVDPTAAVTSLRSQHPVLVKLSKQYEGSLTPVLRQQYAERLTFLYAQLDAIEKGTPACC